MEAALERARHLAQAGEHKGEEKKKEPAQMGVLARKRTGRARAIESTHQQRGEHLEQVEVGEARRRRRRVGRIARVAADPRGRRAAVRVGSSARPSQRAIRAALPYMRKAGYGRIVNVASTEGLGATPGNSPYVAAKHGVIGLTRGLAVDLGREGITVNCICPGPIITGITAGIPDEHKEIYAKRRVPLRRYGIPEEVANITLSCVLPAASFMTGVFIPVDGGLTIKNA